MILSSNQSDETSIENDNVEWKVNALLMAGKQAKKYARQAIEADVTKQGFAPWVPQRLYNSDEKVEQSLQDLAPASEKESGILGSEDLEQEQAIVLSDEEIKIQQLEVRISDLEEEKQKLAIERYEEGYTQGKQDTQHSLESQYAMLDGLMRKLGDIRVDIKDYVGYVETLALELARGVLRQSASEVEYYRHLVREGIEMLGPASQQELSLYVNPDTQKMLEGRLDDLGLEVTILPDPHLDLGDLRLVFGCTEIEELMTQKLAMAFDRLSQSRS
jgi:flagellar biosynthesis/type III secretory pathway protein FliH